MKNLFIREKKENFNYEYIDKLKEAINLKNISNLTFKKVSNLYEKKYHNEFLYYSFFILNEWIKKNNKIDKYFLEALEKNITSLSLNNYLNAEERNYIYLLKSFIFTSNRNIKTLIVDFPLEKYENVYFHYDQISLYFVNNKNKEKIDNVFEAFFGSKRFFFCGYLNVISINIKDIIKIEFNKKIIIHMHNYSYELVTNDIEIIKLSIKRLYKILKLGEVWEEN